MNDSNWSSGRPRARDAKWPVAICAHLTIACSALAQGNGRWVPGDGIPGVNGTVSAMTYWDPDGPGPRTSLLVVGGSFTFAGKERTNNIAYWDPLADRWSPLGSGLTGGSAPQSVRSLAVLPTGELVAGGRFTTAGGLPASNIAKWNGVGWSPLGTGTSAGGFSAAVQCMLVKPTGELIAGGEFTFAGGVSALRIARWDGTSWSGLGSGASSPNNLLNIRTLGLLANGNLVVGGQFTAIGGVSANNVASLNGAVWSALGGGTPSYVSTLVVLGNGDLVVGGGFSHSLARWDGAAWSVLGGGVSSMVQGSWVGALAEQPGGGLLVGGSFDHAGSLPANSVARWDGANWSTFGAGTNNGILALAPIPTGGFLAGGLFTFAGDVPASHIATCDGSRWSAHGTGMNENLNGNPIFVECFLPQPNGDLMAGGGLTAAGSARADYIARWDRAVWSPVGTGMGGGSGTVWALAAEANGDVVAGGEFWTAGGVQARYVARWNGVSWFPMVGPPPASFQPNNGVKALAVAPNGDIVAGGLFTGNIRRWNGTAWSLMGGYFNGTVEALVALSNGDIIAGGRFTDAAGVAANRVARWNGSVWSPLGSGITPAVGTNLAYVNSLAVLPNGDLVASGYFANAGSAPAGNIAAWNGATWSALGGGMNYSVDALAVLPNGGLVAGGYFTTAGGVAANRIARWDGATWTPLGSGMDDGVHSLAVLPGGDIVAGGAFFTAGDQVSVHFARWTVNPSAAANSFGAGCPGSVGTPNLRVTSLPIVGSTFRSELTNIVPGVAVLAIGWSNSAWNGVPLPLSLSAFGLASGCTNYTSIDMAQWSSHGGTAGFAVTIPFDTTLYGVRFYLQGACVDSGLATPTPIAVSNGLDVQLGS